MPRLADPLSVYSDWEKQQLGAATSTRIWKMDVGIIVLADPSLTCTWRVAGDLNRQATNKQLSVCATSQRRVSVRSLHYCRLPLAPQLLELMKTLSVISEQLDFFF